MALHVLNLSVDPPDHHAFLTGTGETREDLSINEMESVGEWMVEKVLGYSGAVPEHDEADGDENVTRSFFCWVVRQPLLILKPIPPGTPLAPLNVFCRPSSYHSHPGDVLSPPPRRG